MFIRARDYIKKNIRFRKDWRILTTAALYFIFLCAGRAYALEPAIHSSLDKNKIGVGEKVRLTVEMEWKQEKGISIIIKEITPPQSALLEEIASDQHVLSKLTKDGAFARTVIEYTYIGKEKGSDNITPAIVEYAINDDPQNKRIIKTSPIHIVVISRAIWLGTRAVIAFFGVLAACAFFGVFIFFGKRYFHGRPRGDKNVVSETDGKAKFSIDSAVLERRFRKKLRALNGHKVSGDVAAYYSGLEKALLDYVREKYGSDLSVAGMDKLPPDLQNLCVECKMISERVSFSGYEPRGNEQDRLIRALDKYMKSLIPGDHAEDGIETID